MQIESIWVKGFRSLCDVRVEGLGPFNVFYGPNGAGKSNILDAVKHLAGLLRGYASACPIDLEDKAHDCQPWAKAVFGGDPARRELLAATDVSLRDPSRTIVFGARFVPTGDGSIGGPLELRDLSVEVTVNWVLDESPTIRMSMIASEGKDLRDAWPKDAAGQQKKQLLRRLLAQELPFTAYYLVGADRSPRPERGDTPGEQGAKRRGDVSSHLRNGRLKTALLLARISPDHATRRGLDDLRALLAGPPLHRPPFDPVQDPETGSIELHERLSNPNPEGLEIPIHLAGLGVTQIYSILAQAMLSGARVIGIEEPEAHLHAPTSGRALRQLLKRLVEEKFIDQLFIATHSNLFDLDPTGYFDVSLVDGCTRIQRSDLTRIDREHLYEPGPAKHALQKLLEYAPPDEVVFRRGDGAPVTAAEMLRLLQEDDDVAVRFLEDVHGAAVRMVRVGAKKAAAG